VKNDKNQIKKIYRYLIMAKKRAVSETENQSYDIPSLPPISSGENEGKKSTLFDFSSYVSSADFSEAKQKKSSSVFLEFLKSILREVPIEQRVVVYTFFSIYTFFTITSFNHIIVYFKISNNIFYSVLLALAYEVGSFSLILGLIHVQRIGAFTVYLILIFLNIVIAVGNSYSSFIAISDETLYKFCDFIGVEPSAFWKRVIAWVQGSTTPLFALSFAKATLNYIRPEKKDE